MKGGKTALYFFLLMFPAPLFERMVEQTNEEGARRYAGMTAKGNKRRPWVSMTLAHAYLFVAMLIMMGVQGFSDVRHYWNTTHVGLGARKCFRTLMPRDMFLRIHASLRFCTEDERPKVTACHALTVPSVADDHSFQYSNCMPLYVQQVDPSHVAYDRTWKLGYFLRTVQGAIRNHASPGQYLSLDEMMIKARSRVSWLVRLRDKPIRDGIKVGYPAVLGYAWLCFVVPAGVTISFHVPVCEGLRPQLRCDRVLFLLPAANVGCGG